MSAITNSPDEQAPDELATAGYRKPPDWRSPAAEGRKNRDNIGNKI